VLNAIHPDDRAAVDESNRSVAEDGKPVPMEYRIIWPDGTVRVVWAEAGELTLDMSGKPDVLTGIVQDITERYHAQEAQRQSEYFTRETQRIGNIGSYKTDFINGFWESSEVLDQIFGIDQNYGRSIQGWLEIVHPDDRDTMDHYLQEEIILKHNPFNLDYRIIRKSNDETRWVHGWGEVGFDKDGNLISMIGTIQDITERKLAEQKNNEQLIELRRWYSAMLGREKRTMELKKEVNELMAQAGQPPRYIEAQEVVHE
jgi:PAS domain S-box-containing protein